MAVTLKLEPVVGCSIDDVATSACDIARRLNVHVNIECNQVYVVIAPSDSPKDIVEAYRLALAQNSSFAWAPRRARSANIKVIEVDI